MDRIALLRGTAQSKRIIVITEASIRAENARPLPPVVNELAGKVAGIDESETGIVYVVVRVAHGQTSQEVANQDQTVGDQKCDEELSGRIGAKRGRRDEHADGEEIADDADWNDEQRQRVEVDVETDRFYLLSFVIKDARVVCCCCSC